MHIEQEPTPKDSPNTKDMTESADNKHTKSTRLEVWGTDPVMRSECITNHSVNEKVLVTKANADLHEIKIPKAYTDAIKSLEGKSWKEAMDYELNRLEEMNT